MTLNRDKFREMNGYLEGKDGAIDPETLSKSFAYKKNFLKRFIAIGPSQIAERLGDMLYYVTRKYDGEFAMLAYADGEAVTINRSGRTRLGLPCVEEAARLLREAGVNEAILPAEIYVDDSDKRTRVHDLIHALSKKGDVSTLRLAFFDVLEREGQPFRPASYQETWELLTSWFGRGERVKTVEMQEARSNAGVRELYRQWVEEGTAEGLVVRSNMPFVFKIKPRHAVEGVVIGFTEGTGDQQNRVRTLLVALMPGEGRYQIVVHVGGGMEETLKQQIYERLKGRVIPSDYVDTDSNFVAFQMVEPELVMEFSVRDVIYETANGPVLNPVLRVENGRYTVEKIVEGLSLIAPVFERFRDDKQVDLADVRLAQVHEFASFEPEEIVESPQVALQKSSLLLRDVYTKQLGGKFMLQKYLLWKTNKENTGLYPAYILHYTNYSSQRLEPLQRELRASSSEEQIRALYGQYLEENIKQGWQRVQNACWSAEPQAGKTTEAEKKNQREKKKEKKEKKEKVEKVEKAEKAEKAEDARKHRADTLKTATGDAGKPARATAPGRTQKTAPAAQPKKPARKAAAHRP